MTPATAQIPTIEELTDLVDAYATREDLPDAEWVRRHRLCLPLRGLKTLPPSTRFLKRATDVALALFALLLFAPLLLVVAVAVKLTSRGPIIFRQVRVGWNAREGAARPPRRGQHRSRRARGHAGAQEKRERAAQVGVLRQAFRALQVPHDALRRGERGARFAVKDDPRITPIGKLLRRTRLDEVPQLWNVLKGEMSLVGPRPERPEFIAQLSKEIPGYLYRLRLRPGLTGLAQVLNGYDNDLEGFRRKVALDLLYLQNCSLLNDMKILLRTIGVVLTGHGAL
jgi:lipopolysaccharide/colanic/teichoic acid biosynthesis glycosyltransferase